MIFLLLPVAQVRGQGGLEHVHQAAHGGEQDQPPAGGHRRAAREERRRLRHLLPRHDDGQGDAVQPSLPRVLPAKMAVRAGHVPPLPHAALQVAAQEAVVVADEGGRGGGGRGAADPASSATAAAAAGATKSAASARPTRGRGGGGGLVRRPGKTFLDTFHGVQA